MFGRKKRILILKDLTIPFTSGSGINAFSFARALANEGIHTTILTYKWNNNLKFTEIREGVRIIRLPVSKAFILKPFCAAIILMAQSYLVCTNRNIVVHGISPGYLWTICLAKLFGSRCIFRPTTLEVDDARALINRKKHGQRIRLRVLNSLFAYHALTPRFKQLFLAACQNKRIRLIECGQGVDNKLYKPLRTSEITQQREALNLPINDLILISVGNITPRKGYTETFSVLSQLNIPFRYYIIGEYKTSPAYFWNSTEEALNIIDEGNKLLGDKIRFLGKTEDVYRYLQVSDVYILNSSLEGLPNSLQEAMACGVPSAVSNLAGINGYLVKHRDNAMVHNNSDELLKNIEELLQNNMLKEKIVLNARNTIEQEFSFKAITPSYLNMFNIEM